MRPYTYTWLPATGNEYTIAGDQATTTGVQSPTGDGTAYWDIPLNSNILTSLPQTPSLPFNQTKPWVVGYYAGYTFQSIPPQNNGNNFAYRSVLIQSDVAPADIDSITVNGIGLTLNVTAGASPFNKSQATCTLSNPINAVISEDVTLTGGASPYSAQTTTYFQTINYIRVVLKSGAQGTFWVGYGDEGITDPIILDTNKKVFNTTAQVLASGTASGATYTVWQSATDIARPESSAGNQQFFFNPLVGFYYGNSAIAYADPTHGNTSADNGNLVNNSDSAWDTGGAPMTTVWMHVLNNTTETFNFTFIQESKF